MIYVGSDHGGLELKNAILDHLKQEQLMAQDCGTHSTNSVDYPDIAKKVCDHVLEEEDNIGILVCGTGIGVSMTANKQKGIRAALCGDTFSAKMAKEHNNANVLCLGQRVIGTGLALDVVDTFLSSEFQGGRHQRRVDKME